MSPAASVAGAVTPWTQPPARPPHRARCPASSPPWLLPALGSASLGPSGPLTHALPPSQVWTSHLGAGSQRKAVQSQSQVLGKSTHEKFICFSFRVESLQRTFKSRNHRKAELADYILVFTHVTKPSGEYLENIGANVCA